MHRLYPSTALIGKVLIKSGHWTPLYSCVNNNSHHSLVKKYQILLVSILSTRSNEQLLTLYSNTKQFFLPRSLAIASRQIGRNTIKQFAKPNSIQVLLHNQIFTDFKHNLLVINLKLLSVEQLMAILFFVRVYRASVTLSVQVCEPSLLFEYTEKLIKECSDRLLGFPDKYSTIVNLIVEINKFREFKALQLSADDCADSTQKIKHSLYLQAFEIFPYDSLTDSVYHNMTVYIELMSENKQVFCEKLFLECGHQFINFIDHLNVKKMLRYVNSIISEYNSSRQSQIHRKPEIQASIIAVLDAICSRIYSLTITNQHNNQQINNLLIKMKSIISTIKSQKSHAQDQMMNLAMTLNKLCKIEAFNQMHSLPN